MSVLPDFRHHRPETLQEALALLSFDTLPYAGGTELLLAMRSGLLRPDGLVDLKRITGLGSVALDDDVLRIGGTATHQAVAVHRDVRAELPVLAEVLRQVGNPRVRSSGTLGGNLCFAEPKSDVATILGALEATVRLDSPEGSRNVAVLDLVLGPYTADREPNEILTEIVVPLRRGRPATYAKHQTMERPTVGVAAAVTSGAVVRLVIGAVGGQPASFEFDRLDEIDPAGIAGEIEVIPDLTGSEAYKRHIVELYIRRVTAALEAVS